MQLPEEDFLYGQIRGRLRLLAILLATADLLDTSAIRAGYFRSDHRLFELNPISELHQTLHALIVGYQIKAENHNIPDKMIFELEWRDKSDLVQKMSEWLLRWFSSQIRQTGPELEKLSRGSIRWALPWARIVFRNPEGPIPQLTDAALRVLNADLAAQRRIDRDQFAKEFQEAVNTPSSKLFVLPSSSTSDIKYVTEWCKAQVDGITNSLVGQIEAPPGMPMEIASIAAILLEQWRHHLPVCNNETALRHLQRFMQDNKERNFILFAGAEDPTWLTPIFEIVLTRNEGEGSRVCILRCAKGGFAVSNIDIKSVDLSCFTADDVRMHLEHRHGYSLQSQKTLILRMEQLGLLTSPGLVYTYIQDHCDRESWHTQVAT